MTIAIRASHPYKAGTEHVGSSSTRPTVLATSASTVRFSASRIKGKLRIVMNRLLGALWLGVPNYDVL